MADIGWRHLTEDDKRQILKGIASGEAIGGPYHVEVHPADRCNIACFFCSTASLRGTDEMTISRWEELLVELQQAGTRSIRLSGGGEPLFHRGIRKFLEAVNTSGIPIENITTNAVLLNSEIAEILAQTCDEVTVSINTADAESYGAMMKTPPRNFQRVVDNVRGLADTRDRAGKRKPFINLQFLVWKGNFRSIPAMYRLSRDLRCDSVFFNGLAFLAESDRMTDAETAEMMALYEEVLRIDGFRTISTIESYEQPITGRIRALAEKLDHERRSLSFFHRAYDFIRPGEFSLGEKIRHRRKLKKNRESTSTQELDASCIIGWHSLVIRTSGDVAPCCILQGKRLGNVYTHTVQEIWHGDAYRNFRAELTDIMTRGSSWQADEHDTVVESVCGKGSGGGCPISTFYFQRDVAFAEELSAFLGTAPESN